MPIDYWALGLTKAISFGLAVVEIVLLLGVLRWTGLQKLALPFFDAILRMEKRADDGEGGAQVAVGVAHGLVTAGILYAAAILAGVAH